MKYYPLIGIVTAVGIWQIIIQIHVLNPLFVASPLETFQTLFQMLASGLITQDILATLFRLCVGFVLAAIIGIPMGLALGSNRIYLTLSPIVDFLRSIPPTALLPLFLLVTGIEISKIATVVFGCSMIIAVNSMYGVHHANRSRILYSKSLGASRFQIMRKVTWPESLSYQFLGLRQSLNIALIIVVVGEMIIPSNHGLGLVIYNSQLTYRMPQMYATILLTGIIGYVLNVCFVKVEHRIIHWVGKS